MNQERLIWDETSHLLSFCHLLSGVFLGVGRNHTLCHHLTFIQTQVQLLPLKREGNKEQTFIELYSIRDCAGSVIILSPQSNLMNRVYNICFLSIKQICLREVKKIVKYNHVH